MVYFSVEDTKNMPVNIYLIDVNSNTVITKSMYKQMDESCIYWISLPMNSFANLEKVILQSESIDDTIKLEIDFGNSINPVLINGFVFKSSFDNRTNFYTFKEIFYDDVYYDEIVRVEENDIVVDIGANIGFFSVYAIQFKPKKIICLEPDINSYITLLENTKNFENINSYNLAISNENGIMDFCYSENISAGSHLKKFDAIIGDDMKLETKVLTIKIEKLFDLFNLTHIDYLKLDCEGGERDVFETIENSTLRKIKKISLEFHSLEIKNIITEKLATNGFEITQESFLHSSTEVGLIFAFNKNY